MTLFAGMMHMHAAGKSMQLQHLRDGKELPKLLSDNYYDAKYQEFQSISGELQPGDQLLTTCTWDTSARTSPTMGGLGTEEEMCFSYLLYYPKVGVEKCLSTPAGSSLNSPLSVECTSTTTQEPASIVVPQQQNAFCYAPLTSPNCSQSPPPNYYGSFGNYYGSFGPQPQPPQPPQPQECVSISPVLPTAPPTPTTPSPTPPTEVEVVVGANGSGVTRPWKFGIITSVLGAWVLFVHQF
jgi:hypothetical protein